MRYRMMNFMSRHRFLINKDLQFELLLSTLFYVFLIITMVGAALFIPLFVDLEKGGGSDGEVQQAAARIALYLDANFWPAALFSLALICLLSLRTSHRIAGPLNHITLVLESLKNGELPEAVRIRKGDHLAAEIDVTNQMLDRLRIQLTAIQGAQAELNDAIIACEKTMGHASTESISDRMHYIREKAGQLAKSIGYFKIV